MDDFPARELALRLALLRLHEGNPRVLRRLLVQLPSVEAALAAHGRLPPAVRELLAPLCDGSTDWRALIAPDVAFLREQGACALAADAPGYPALLAEIADAPPLLFCQGDHALLERPQVAIVGSRHASPAGLANARAFAADLAAAGFVITSGMAMGVDAMAHEGALAAGGDTVAVLGCGIDRVYPRRHAALARGIRARGCLVSELPPGSAPMPAHFPQRNRIISGLVLGVLVVEAAPDSGSLITARFAAEQGREVFAIPGSIHSPMSRGCHQLIREGATLVETSAQLVDALGHFALPRRQARAAPSTLPLAMPLTDEELRVLAAVSPAGSGIDQLVAQTGLPVATVAALLSALAVGGRVHALPGGLWQPAA